MIRMMVFSLCGGWVFFQKKMGHRGMEPIRNTGMCTLPETNMFAPENRQSQMEIHLPSINFRGELLFREGKPGWCEWVFTHWQCCFPFKVNYLGDPWMQWCRKKVAASVTVTEKIFGTILSTPERLRWNLQITHFEGKWSEPNLHDYVPC